jgi:hypothetical protein
MIMISLYLRLMDPPREKRSKFGHDGAGSSKRGHKTVVSHRAPPQASPPSDHNEDEEPKALMIHEPVENTNRVFIKYSKKIKLSTITKNCEALVYIGSRMCTNQHFLCFFHADWYQSVYVPKMKPVVETKWVNWEWMRTHHNNYFNLIKETCD